jgi:hypothetical protein
MTAEFIQAGDFLDVEDQLQSRWLAACRAQMAAESGLWDGAWKVAADAWADLARASPPGNLQDAEVWWSMAARAARRARR